ncbi:hypothetical protein BDR26DRAFT_922225 [Obelidium mucronatum]|nr:hypothetical protein BDR26DRAFT_922225 [Obelidium mucronatum]
MTHRNIDMDALIADLDSSLGVMDAPSSAMPATVGELLSDASALSGFLNIVPSAALRHTELPWVRRFFVLSKDRVCQFASSAASEYVLDEVILGQGARLAEDSQRANNSLAFEVNGIDGKLWILSATTRVSKETWIDMISLLISRSNDSAAKPVAIPRQAAYPRRGDSDTVRSMEDVYGKSPRRTNAEETVRGLDNVYRNAAPRQSDVQEQVYILSEQLEQAQSELNERMMQQQSSYQSPRTRTAQMMHHLNAPYQESMSSAGTYYSPREDSSSSLHSSHSTHFERDAHGFLAPISPAQSSSFRRQDAFVQPQQNLHHARSYSSDVGVRGGGIFGSERSADTSTLGGESVKSDDSNDKKKKKNHKAQMMKTFVQF